VALKFIEALDINDHLVAIKAALAYSLDFRLDIKSSTWSIFYDQARDRVLSEIRSTSPSGQPLNGSFDPLLVDASAPRGVLGPVLASFPAPFYGGYFDRDAGTQLIYNANPGYSPSTAEFNTTDPSTLSPDGGLAFGATGPFVGRSRTTIGLDGYFSAAERWIFFEGLTDGIPGETLTTGTNVYPRGLGLTNPDVGRVPAAFGPPFDGGGNNANNALGWVDLETGNLVGALLNTTGVAALVSTGLFAEPPVAGQVFRYEPQMFVPDVDSTAGAPKGELFLISSLGDRSYTTGLEQAFFIKIVDFNPFALTPGSGAPVRVHERVTLKTAIEFSEDPIFGVPSSEDLTAAFTTSAPGDTDVIYHPPTRRFIVVVSPTGQTPTGSQLPEYGFVGYWQRAVDPVVIGDPVLRDVAATNSIAEMVAFVGGNLGEPSSGTVVDFTLERASTIDEVVDASGGIGAAPALEAAEIDDTFPSSAQGTLVLTATTAGVPTVLVETTDFTVVLSTGVITFVTDQSSADTVTATYFHGNVPLSPAHGTLLVDSAITNEAGLATTRVSYPDNAELVGHYDDVSTALA